MTEAQKAAVERLRGYAENFDAVTRAGIASLQSDIRLVLDALEKTTERAEVAEAIGLQGKLCISEQHRFLEAKVREQAEEIAHLRDRDKLSDEAVAALTTQRNAMAEEIERLKKERDGAVKQALEQHRIVQDLGRELRAERAQREKLEKAVQRHLMAIGHDAADETDCDVGFGCTLCELSKALRHDAPWPCGHAKLHHEDELCRECSP